MCPKIEGMLTRVRIRVLAKERVARPACRARVRGLQPVRPTLLLLLLLLLLRWVDLREHRELRDRSRVLLRGRRGEVRR